MAEPVPGLRKETTGATGLGGLLDKVVAQFRRIDAQIRFVGKPFSGARPVEVPVEISDGAGVRSTFSTVGVVRVKIVFATAAGARLEASAASKAVPEPGGQEFDVPLREGRGTVLVNADGTGIVDLSLEDIGASGLDVTDLATVTLS